MRWEIGLSTGIAYTRPILETLEPIAAAGFRTLEVSSAPKHLDLDHPRALRTVRTRIDGLGLSVTALHAPFGEGIDLTAVDVPARERAMDRLTRAADALAILGGTFYVIHPGSEDSHWSWERDERLARAAEGLTWVHEVCRARRLTLALETPLPHLLGGELDDLDWLLERIPAEGTGVCVDTSHLALGGTLLAALKRFGPRLVHVQASDNHGVTDDHLPPGTGTIDWPALTRTLEEVGYDGVFVLEIAGGDDVVAHVEWTAAATHKTFPSMAPAARS